MKTRILALVCALALLLCALGAPALADDVITIEVLSDANASDDSALESNFVRDRFKEKLGVDVAWNYNPELQTTLNMRSMSDDLPEIFAVPSRAMLTELAEDGYVLNLSDYADQLPDAFAFIEENIAAGKVGGDVYAIATRPYAFRAATWYNAKWFEQCGVTAENMPDTLEGFLALCRDLVARDLDGNGQNDTIGLTGTKWKTLRQLFGAYGCTIPNKLVCTADGTITDTMLSPAYYDALCCIRELWAEGFIDHEIFSLSDTQAVEKAMTGTALLVSCDWPSIKKAGVVESFLALDPDARWEIVGELTGPTGDRYVGDYNAQSYQRLYAVNADLADEPEKLSKVLSVINYVATEEGLELTSYGVEGEHWSRGENGAVNVFPEKVQKINFSWVYKLCGREDLSYCRMKFGEAAWPYILATSEQAWLDDVTKIIDKPSWYNATDADTFISESVMAFISGDAELTPESWAAFLEKLDTTYQYGEFIDYANGYYHELSGK